MANIAGVRRIKITGKVIMLIGITFAVLNWGAVVWHYRGNRRADDVIGCACALSYPVGFGALVWAAGWVTEGFFQPEV